MAHVTSMSHAHVTSMSHAHVTSMPHGTCNVNATCTCNVNATFTCITHVQVLPYRHCVYHHSQDGGSGGFLSVGGGDRTLLHHSDARPSHPWLHLPSSSLHRHDQEQPLQDHQGSAPSFGHRLWDLVKVSVPRFEGGAFFFFGARGKVLAYTLQRPFTSNIHFTSNKATLIKGTLPVTQALQRHFTSNTRPFTSNIHSYKRHFTSNTLYKGPLPPWTLKRHFTSNKGH